MISVPLVEALKKHKTYYHRDDFLSLPPDTPYGNLNLTYVNIVTRVELLNELISELYRGFYKHYEEVKENNGMSHPPDSFRHKFQIEQVIYWMRKTADEIISILYVLHFFKTEKNYPEQIKISSIGKFISNGNTQYYQLNEHLKFFSVLNDVSNAYKHTILNAQISNYIGQDEPVVFALSAFNTSTAIPKFHSISLKSLILSFDDFLRTAKNILKENYEVGIVNYNTNTI